uniref:Uncharacterized protein n=1 Tax=Anguilla anguilla TaxID=7936 RepID=A0A0E9XE03_ANGAN
MFSVLPRHSYHACYEKFIIISFTKKTYPHIFFQCRISCLQV